MRQNMRRQSKEIEFCANVKCNFLEATVRRELKLFGHMV